MKTAFGSKADFLGMDGSRELFISAILHKAFNNQSKITNPQSVGLSKGLANNKVAAHNAKTFRNAYSAPVAQWIEQRISNPWVAGSIPAGGARLFLDTAAAYGWPSGLTDSEILGRLLALNLDRARK